MAHYFPEGQEPKYDKLRIAGVFKELEAKIVRWNILDTGKRIDGRDAKTVRNIIAEVGVLPRAQARRCSPAVKPRDNIDGALYVIANYCSHEGAPLCAGYVGGTNEFAPDMPGQLRHVREGQIARCPWHNWEFDIATGVNLADPQKRVRTYEVDATTGRCI